MATRALLLSFLPFGFSAFINQYAPLSSDCPCGYYIPETNLFFTHRLTLDPSLFKYLDTVSYLNGTSNSTTYSRAFLTANLEKQGFATSNYLLENTPQKTDYTPDNIAYNRNTQSLEIKVSGNEGPSSQTAIKSGEIASLAQSIRYGSFRFTTKMDAQPGACHGLFFYKSNAEEIDIEVTTRWTYGMSTIHDDDGDHPTGLQYTIQGPSGQTKNTPFDSSFNPTTTYHEYRFDWKQGKVVYFSDGKKVNELEGWTPGAGWADGEGGQVMVNNWSDGDMGWTGEAPIKDNILSVRRVDVYYNSTDITDNMGFAHSCFAARDRRMCLVT